MKLHYLLTAVAASALMAGAAHAQLGAGTEPDAGVTPNQSAPADPKDAKTGVPSVDSTRPTGVNAGQTSLPGGTVESETDASATTSSSATTAAPSASTDTTISEPSTDTSAAAATGAAVSASTGGNVQVVSNGPVPDTAENRAKYGGPMSRAGKRTAPAGN